MQDHWHGKHLWIIGASSGIGAALAQQLAAKGATLSLSARRVDALQELAAALPGEHALYALDIADGLAVQHVTEQVAQRRKLDGVFIMAALYEPMRMDALHMDKVTQIIAVNLTGMFHIVHAVFPALKKQGRGLLALCGSVAGYRGLPNGQPYSATKAAVINLCESLRIEAAGTGVDVRLISPGFVRTDLTAKNDFDMPALLEPEEAACAIVQGLESGAYEIHFPKRFTYFLKLLRIIPIGIYLWIGRKINKK